MKNWSIRTRIIVAWVVILVLIIIVDLTFYNIFSVLETNARLNITYYNFVTDYSKYLENQKNFLINYQKDPIFFRTEQSQSLKRQELSYLKVKNDLQGIIESHTLSVNEQNKFSQILNLIENKQNYFNDLVHKLYLRGNVSTKSGMIGKIIEFYNIAIHNTNDPNLLKLIDKIYKNFLKYLVSLDERNYQDFLKNYTILNKYLQNQQLAAFTGQLDTNISVTPTYNYSETLLNALSNFKNKFRDLVHLDSEIGLLNVNSGILSNIKSVEENLDLIINKVREQLIDQFQKTIKNNTTVYLIFFLTLIALSLVIFISLQRFIIKRLEQIRNYIEPLQYGELPEELEVYSNDEVGELFEKLNVFITALHRTADFAVQLGQGNFDVDFKPLSDKDILGNALLRLREDLKKAREEEEKRKQEERIRQWTNEGISKFADILRQKTDSLADLARIVIKNLVNYLNANQGAFFYLNDEDPKNIYLELLATYAYNRERKKKKIFKLGEGLVGTVALEKETVYMTDIPDDYISITSGLGGAKPRSLLIVPLKAEDEIVGVIELASFNEFKDYEIKFVEHVAESIAATVSITKINERTNRLLTQAQIQAREMAAQEEEMRQNLEELKATQEEAARREAELRSLLNGIEAATFVTFIDLNGFITHANDNLLNFLGISQNDYVGHHISEFDLTGELAKDEFWNKLKSGQILHYTRHFKINDREFWFDEFYVPIFDKNGNVVRFIAVAFDITKRIQQQQLLEKQKKELEEKERQYKKLVEEQKRTQEILQKQKEQAERISRKLKANEQVLKQALDEAKHERERAEELSKRLIHEKMELASEYEYYLSAKELIKYLDRRLKTDRERILKQLENFQEIIKQKDKLIEELRKQIEELKKEHGNLGDNKKSDKDNKSDKSDKKDK